MQQSYNHSAWQYPRPPHHAVSLDVRPPFDPPPPRTRHVSVYGPISYPGQAINTAQSFIPPSLTPGGQRARIWDKRTTQRPRSSQGSMPSPSHTARTSLYGDYFFSQQQAPPPPLPQKPQALLNPLTNHLPPIPPKPAALAIPPASRIPLYPTSIPLAVVSPSSKASELVSENLPSPDEKEIELALTLSASEAQKREQELIEQEQEDLARALEESRLLSNTAYALGERSPTSPTSPGSPSIDRPSVSALRASARPPEGESWLHLITPTASTSSRYSSPSLDEDVSLSPHEPEEGSSDLTRGTPVNVSDTHSSWDTSSPTPPLYANVVSNLVRSPSHPSSHYSTVSPLSPTSTPTAYLQSDCSPPPDHRLNSPSLSLARSSSSDRLPTPPFAPGPSWSSVSSENSLSAGRPLGSEPLATPSPTHVPTSPDHSIRCSPVVGRSDEGVEEDTDPGPFTRQDIPLTANQYVEQEMLMGISLGFTLPVISTELSPMTGAMPNVITLPYGKAPVFHFQAPSWRKLLKLMAKLSGTRVEPTLEALNVAGHDLKLRTVIQFVKIHHSASQWRTILYLTTDFPVPPKVPNSHKYANGDITILPYSYTLSQIPALLRDGPESPMAKYYVVPSTSTTPYPTLPINFPNLAMYLQSAVQDSRRSSNDSSGGIRKLAQYIDSCYQKEAEHMPIDQEAVPKKGVGGMFKRVMGRGKANRRSGGNEEIYDLVTPFVSDEWG